MNYNHSDPENTIRAAATLKELLGEAQKIAQNNENTIHPVSALGESMLGYARISNVAGVHIYETPAGHYADIVLTWTPPGITNTFGTPTKMPQFSYEDARNEAINLLAITIVIERTPSPQAQKEVPFIFNGITFLIPSETIASITTLLPSEKRQVVALLTKFEDTLPSPLPDNFFELLSSERKTQFSALACLALASGFMRWPKSTEPDIKPGHA